MQRRRFIYVVGGVATWPLVARAQKPPAPVVGFLGTATSDQYTARLRAFRQGLNESGYVEGQNVLIEYRWAQDDNSRLPSLAAELVDRRVAAIVAAGSPAALAAKAATATIPIVFAAGVDPVQLGLVASLSRPGGNVTGVTNLDEEIGPKRLQILHELLPKATTVGLLVNPTSPNAEQFPRALQPSGRAFGMRLHVVEASTEGDFDAVFESLAKLRAEALVICPDVFFSVQSEKLAARALRQALPAIYQFRPFAAAGGLASYSANETEYYRLAGSHTGKILNGRKPADLPVEQLSKIELIINVRTAKTLGISVPQSLLAQADEVIE